MNEKIFQDDYFFFTDAKDKKVSNFYENKKKSALLKYKNQLRSIVNKNIDNDKSD